jgi:hypothetical protein
MSGMLVLQFLLSQATRLQMEASHKGYKSQAYDVPGRKSPNVAIAVRSKLTLPFGFHDKSSADSLWQR